MSAESNIDTAIDALTAEIADLSANRKPSYSLEGQSVSWESYYTSRVTALEKLLTIRASLGSPVEIRTQGFS